MPAYVERRAEPRTPVRAAGRVMFGDKLGLWADCVIRDMSTSGAKIELSELVKLPPRFLLIHLQEGIAFEVVLKWRRGDLAGMAFEKRHPLTESVEPRLEPVRAAWVALMPGFTPGAS
ncbi:MAG TPA: PilZ domain-containing protein [Phenylobacterium sp.]|nr:PilZ domain-containing protein [Phenylobacterium sp.]